MQVVDFIERVVKSLNYTINVDSFLVVGLETELHVCKTLHARIGSMIEVDGVVYEVTGVKNNDVIIIKGLPANPKLITLTSPYYLHGTTLAVNTELDKLDKDIKFPFIYCFEAIRERYYNEADSLIDRDADIRLFFLDNANFADWTTEEHYRNTIDGMRNLQQELIKKLNNHKSVGLFSDYEVINHVKFGVYTERGHERKIFNDNTSGVEILLTLPLYIGFEKCDYC
jgi:hypothetical protein